MRNRLPQILYSHAKSSRVQGFTLIELAVVLIVIGFLLAGVLGPLSTRIEAGERQRAEDELKDIKEAIYGFAVANGRLPCPDTDADGSENLTAGACTAIENDLPWQTLGTPQQDPWGNRYLYRVTANFADNPPSGTGGLCTVAAVQSAFNLCDNGDITVNDAGGTALASQVPAVILSEGSNRNDPALAVGGALSAFEAENSDADTPSIFVSKVFSRDAAQEFDDFVVWISPNVLKNRMVTAGRLP